ncbi:MAG: hypothetical protein ACYTGQ_14730 [Planctomycetota bacterium]|jgi:hypothetical protein
MAPIPSLTTRQVDPAIPPSVRPFTPGPEAFGAGLGRGVQQAGGAMARAEELEKRRTNAMAVMDAYADALSLQSDLLYGKEHGLARQSGQNLLDAVDPAMEAWDRGIDSIGGRLSPEQQQLFAARTESLRGRFTTDLSARQSQARIEVGDARQKKIMTDVLRAALEGVQEGGVSVAEDGTLAEAPVQAALEDFYSEGGILDAFAPHMAEKLGVPEADARQRMVDEFEHALHRQTVDQLLADIDERPENVDVARAYYETHRDEIVVERREEIEADIAQAFKPVDAQRAAQVLFDEHFNPAAKGETLAQQERAAKAGVEDPKLRKAITNRFAMERDQQGREAFDAQKALISNILTTPRQASFDHVTARWPGLWEQAKDTYGDAVRGAWETHVSGGFVTTEPAYFNKAMDAYQGGDDQVRWFLAQDFKAWNLSGWLGEDDAAMFTQKQKDVWEGRVAGTAGLMTGADTLDWFATAFANTDDKKSDAYQAAKMGVNQYVISLEKDGKLTPGQIGNLLNERLYQNKVITAPKLWFGSHVEIGDLLADEELDLTGAEIYDAYQQLRDALDASPATRGREITRSQLIEKANAIKESRGIR